MYDCLLGGKDHFEADRQAISALLKAVPNARTGARENRAFLGRAVRYLVAEAGIRQFLDIGAGLPTANNVHEVAQAIAPDSRVAYVDNDPIVMAHARALLTSRPEGQTAYIQADLHDPESILNNPSVRETLDFGEPIALVLMAILHFFPAADNPADIVSTLVAALPPGSYLVASHALQGILRGDSAGNVKEQYKKNVASGATLCDRDEILRFFAGLELIEPGLLQVPHWRPDEPESPDASKLWVLGGVGRITRPEGTQHS